MSTLAVVEEILRDVKKPVSVREIVEAAGERLPTRSKTPDTVVARDLSMDIKKKGEASKFIRTSPGRYTMREFVTQADAGATAASADNNVVSASQTRERASVRPATSPAIGVADEEHLAHNG